MRLLIGKNSALFLALAILVACQPEAESQAPDTSQASTDRIVVIGDLHSDIGVTREAFRLAGATDENDEWIGGSLTVVQLGDFLGRSDDERQVFDFMFDIREKAEAGGGAVHVLIGNHEVFAGRVDNQAVGPNPFPAYEDMAGLDVDDPRLARLPPHQRKRGAALMAGGPLAQRLAELTTVLKLNDTIFVHAGVLPRWANYGIDRINEEMQQWFLGNSNEPNASRGVDNTDKVMWTRQLSYNVQFYDCTQLDESLEILGAQRMIVAHTVRPEITSDCDGKLWGIDVGMSRAYGGDIQLLEIINGNEISVLRP
jgi:hypothetical protein